MSFLAKLGQAILEDVVATGKDMADAALKVPERRMKTIAKSIEKKREAMAADFDAAFDPGKEKTEKTVVDVKVVEDSADPSKKGKR